jgi:hypothetical protein
MSIIEISQDTFMRLSMRRCRYIRFYARELDTEMTRYRGIELTKTAYLSYYYRIPLYHRFLPINYYNLYMRFMDIIFASDETLRNWITIIPNFVNIINEVYLMMKFFYQIYFKIFFDEEREYLENNGTIMEHLIPDIFHQFDDEESDSESDSELASDSEDDTITGTIYDEIIY